jgi:hypothetical protein
MPEVGKKTMKIPPETMIASKQQLSYTLHSGDEQYEQPIMRLSDDFYDETSNRKNQRLKKVKSRSIGYSEMNKISSAHKYISKQKK